MKCWPQLQLHPRKSWKMSSTFLT
ncbi:hypothetical protein Celaphus_00011789 [Cervus elaphus hippelaphus]|uniref:Uncharacterized protein n=1 Tax=Cervus elaphus hippelaphus TaxID=46360 RepID=A0A212DFJ6_CEREH|nr:hypothetical protein Celaphus_00011789 [Cervus elaphus hippelaphus]